MSRTPNPDHPSIWRIGVRDAGRPARRTRSARDTRMGATLAWRGAIADVVVVGAGPAGAAAATVLARAGRDVVVVDKAVFPRDKCCGDGLTTLALRELERSGSSPARSPTGRSSTAPCCARRAAARSACRCRRGRARTPRWRRGCSSTTRSSTSPPRPARRSCRATASTVTSTIVATTSWSASRATARSRRATSSPPTACGARCARRSAWPSPATSASGTPSASTSATSTAPAARDLFVWFDADLLPGYAWSFPLPGGRANVGFGVLRDGTRRIQDMKALWAGLLDRPHIRAALGPRAAGEGRHTAWPIPARIDAAPLTAGRVLLTGDAAMATDVMTGEGIGQALLTGRLAAEAILAAGALDDATAAPALRVDGPPPPRRRPPHVGPPRSRAGPRPRRPRRDRGARPRRLVEPAQLRPLDVRGRATGDRRHPVALAPPRAAPARARSPIADPARGGGGPVRGSHTSSSTSDACRHARRGRTRSCSRRRRTRPTARRRPTRRGASPGRRRPTTPATRPTARRRRGRRGGASPTTRGGRGAAARRWRRGAR